MKRKVVALLCIMAMTLSLFAGCKGNDTEDTQGNSKPDVTNNDKTKSGSEEGTKEPEVTPESISAYSEAPILANLVSTGTLAKVEERLPVAEDIMIETMDSIGKYGEAFNFTFDGKGSQWFYGKITEEGLFRFKTDGTVEPNVAKGYDVNEDATVYTIYLREGMKWSDGVPFTAEDVVFFYDEMCVKETFGKALWDCFKVVDENGVESTADFEKVDDYTVKVTFQYSKPTFLENLAINGKWCFAPAHWYKEILPSFIGEEAAAAKATEMGYADAASMGKETGYYYWNVPGRPTLRPWIVTKDGSNNNCDGEYFVMERNPYYWKTDAEGKQLPYIDELRFTRISDAQQGLLKILDGTVDISTVAYTDYDVLVEGQEAAGYELLEWSGVFWSDYTAEIQLNQTVKDEKKRSLFQNVDFRQALSIAVNREEYAEILTDGFASGIQSSPGEGAMGYSEEWKNQWTEYNTTKAKQLLEGCGLVMGSDGFYDFADGTDFVLNLQTFTEAEADKSAEMLMEYYKQAGIKTTYKPVDRSVLDNMTISNDHEAIIAPVVRTGAVSIILRPDSLVPVRNYAAWYGAVGNWYASHGAEGVAPTGDLLELCNLYDQLKAAMTTEAQQEIALKMLALHQKNQWVIGYVESLPTLIAKDTKIMNFPDVSVYSDEFRDMGIAHLQNCYFAD